MFLQRVQLVEERYEELNRQLSDPDVIGNPGKLKDVAQEHRELEQLVELYRKLKEVMAELEDNRGIIEEDEDPELVELAKAELPELESQSAQLEEQIKLQLIPKDPADAKNAIISSVI